MTIGLDSFGQAANLGARRIVIDGDQLHRGSQSFMARAISIMTGVRQKENKAVYESFALALESEFGSVGRDLLLHLAPNNGSRLSSSTIRLVIDHARIPALSEALRSSLAVNESPGALTGVADFVMIQQKVDPLQALTSSEYLRLNIPYNESTKPGVCTDENLAGPMTKLGNGQFNTVYLGTYRLPDGNEYAGVFKKETTAGGGWVAKMTGIDSVNPQFGMRNIATYRLNQLLGLDVIPRTEFGIHQGELGIVMGLAPGSSCTKQDYEFELTGESGDPSLDFLAGKKSDLEKLATSELLVTAAAYGLQELRFDGDRLMAVGDVDVGINFEDPALLEGLNDLQWLDALCAQGDRHAGNYLVEQNAEGRVTHVTGIDNDQSFGKTILNPNDIAFGSDAASEGFRGCLLPEVISRKTAQAFKQLTPDTLLDTLSGLLTSDELDASEERLDAIKSRVVYLEEIGRVIDPGGWDFNDTKLADFWDDADVSYVARDRVAYRPIKIAYDAVVAKN